MVVASNLFGDILSDLGPACTGTIGIAPPGNINPERRYPSLFESVHGSAPDIAGQGVANLVGQIWSAAMMLDHLGELEAASAILSVIESVLQNKMFCTLDVGRLASTVVMGHAIADVLTETPRLIHRSWDVQGRGPSKFIGQVTPDRPCYSWTS